ncbi:MAG TPA: hypothetical protein VL752_04650 [Acidisoma sp.]|jgi:hypothetical protein|uniref:hypothetical protein n=1 Tax=Acidisoma sp. TaxID=1872115 RepID=UPI002C0EF333|nr:hypothetical protein [Acidisoma sp.]HTI00218.1 hypothetical protein [Acidisoma sp.]
MAKTAKKNAKSHRPRLIRRGLVVLAIAILWAAGHQPTSFTPSSLLIWVLGMLTVALFARAAFAVLEPVLKLGTGLVLYGLQRQHHLGGDES